MNQGQKRSAIRIFAGVSALLALGLLTVSGSSWRSQAADEAAAPKEGECCKAGDKTPPVELVKQVPPGGLHSPYQDYAKLAKEEELVKDFRLPGCNECHGGGGGGGMCPALSQGIWFWGNTDDVLFRLVTLGSAELEKSGFTRYQYGQRARTDAADGFLHPYLGRALEDHRLHSFDQSSWNQPSRKSYPWKDDCRRSALADRG